MSFDLISDKYFWLAPENVRGSNTIDTRSDIWGIGCLAFEMLTGHPPFFLETGGNVDELKRM